MGFLPHKAPKPIKDNTLESLNGYHKTLFIRTTSCPKENLKGSNPFQVVVWVQTTFKTKWFSHNLFHLCYLSWEPPYLILMIKYGFFFHGMVKKNDKKGLEIVFELFFGFFLG